MSEVGIDHKTLEEPRIALIYMCNHDRGDSQVGILRWTQVQNHGGDRDVQVDSTATALPTLEIKPLGGAGWMQEMTRLELRTEQTALQVEVRQVRTGREEMAAGATGGSPILGVGLLQLGSQLIKLAR